MELQTVQGAREGGGVGAPLSAREPVVRALIRLARPQQWTKSAFVLIGPVYAWANNYDIHWVSVAGVVLAFSLASSACYVVNDIQDREADRAHPRKRNRPIASGAVPVSSAVLFAGALFIGAAASLVLVPFGGGSPSDLAWVTGALGVYVLNTLAYSLALKRAIVLDVVSLAAGFVLRVLGGCAAAGVQPTTWLLNCTFFVAMFLAFGKRLGERRTSGDAASVRSVQSTYTDELLRMSVVVTAVAALVSYAFYVQEHEDKFRAGFNLLWLTILPATYGLLRCIVLMERGEYDDPTELAAHDWPFQLSALAFAGITLVLALLSKSQILGMEAG
ncbi:MAG: UbiA prenyltransferase family protein [Tepidiformaceae bacterium]